MNINPVSQKGVLAYPSAEKARYRQTEQASPLLEQDFQEIQYEIYTLIAILSGDKEPPEPQMLMGLVYIPFIRGIGQKIQVKKLIRQLKKLQQQHRLDAEEMQPLLAAIQDTINRLRPKASPAMILVLMRISSALNGLRKIMDFSADNPTLP